MNELRLKEERKRDLALVTMGQCEWILSVLQEGRPALSWNDFKSVNAHAKRLSDACNEWDRAFMVLCEVRRYDKTLVSALQRKTISLRHAEGLTAAADEIGELIEQAKREASLQVSDERGQKHVIQTIRIVTSLRHRAAELTPLFDADFMGEISSVELPQLDAGQ